MGERSTSSKGQGRKKRKRVFVRECKSEIVKREDLPLARAMTDRRTGTNRIVQPNEVLGPGPAAVLES